MNVTGPSHPCGRGRARSGRADARLAAFDYIEAFYNHSALGYLSPADLERRYRSAQQIA